MLRKLITFAITSGLAKKAWDHYRQGRQARATAGMHEVDPAPARPGRRKASRRKSGPAA